MVKKETVIASLFAIIAFAGIAMSSFTSGPLGLTSWELGDFDYVTTYNTDNATLDASVLDKRVGGTITGDLVITGSLIAGTTEAGSFSIQGSTSNVVIRGLSCVGGAGKCMVASTDEGDMYISIDSTPGGYRNLRTGKVP